MKDNGRKKRPYLKNMRKIWHISVHCSDSDHAHHDNKQTIHNWHVVERKWRDIGYHYLILKNGTVENCRPISRVPAAVSGHNTGMIAICLTGRNRFSAAQFNSLRELVKDLQEKYSINSDNVRGHKDYPKMVKTCPNFDVQEVVFNN